MLIVVEAVSRFMRLSGGGVCRPLLSCARFHILYTDRHTPERAIPYQPPHLTRTFHLITVHNGLRSRLAAYDELCCSAAGCAGPSAAALLAPSPPASDKGGGGGCRSSRSRCRISFSTSGLLSMMAIVSMYSVSERSLDSRSLSLSLPLCARSSASRRSLCARPSASRRSLCSRSSSLRRRLSAVSLSHASRAIRLSCAQRSRIICFSCSRHSCAASFSASNCRRSCISFSHCGLSSGRTRSCCVDTN